MTQHEPIRVNPATLPKGPVTASPSLLWSDTGTSRSGAGRLGQGCQGTFPVIRAHKLSVAEANLIWVSGLASGVGTACTSPAYPSLPLPGDRGCLVGLGRPDIISRCLLWPHHTLHDE